VKTVFTYSVYVAREYERGEDEELCCGREKGKNKENERIMC